MEMPWNNLPNNPSQVSSMLPSESNNTKGSKKKKVVVPKADWNIEMTTRFIRLCIVEINNGNRPNSHFNPRGWENIVTKFQQATGCNYTKDQLKNKWDAMRKQWGIWTRLWQNETGLGWDHARGTIVASDEWWERKLQVTPKPAKFRTKGPLLVQEQAIMFSDVVANGSESWAPSSGVMPLHMQDELPGELDGDEEEEEVGQDDIDVELNVDIDQNQLHGEELPTQAQPMQMPIQGTKRKRPTFPPICRTKPTKKPTTAQQVVKCLQTMAKRIEVGCSCGNKHQNDTLGDCLTILENMDGVEEGGNLWLYATRVFLKSNVRDMFLGLKKDSTRLIWLKAQMERDMLKRGATTSQSGHSGSRGMSGENDFTYP